MLKMFLFLFFTVACGPKSQLAFTVKEAPFPVSNELRQSTSYQDLYEKVLSPKCLGCHDAGSKVPLNTYKAVRSNLGKIRWSVFIKHSMPRSPVSRLTRRELEVVAAWIEARGPNSPLDGSGQPYTPSGLEPTYESLKTNVFDRKCLVCHSPGGNAANVPMVTKEDLLNPNFEMVVPGNPDDSGLLLVLKEGARKFMPPKTSDFSLVSEEEKAMIKTWILSGAQ